MRQLEHEELRDDVEGFASGPFFKCRELARSAFGEQDNNTGLTLAGYLYRRFGPTWWGSDEHKELCSYILTTEIEGLYLTCNIKAMSINWCFGVLFDDRVKAKLPEDQRTENEFSEKCRLELVRSMQELRRPVYIRDIPINCLGVCQDDGLEHPAERSKYAGFGMPKEALDAAITADV